MLVFQTIGVLCFLETLVFDIRLFALRPTNLQFICPCQICSHLMEKQANNVEFHTKHITKFTFEVVRKKTCIRGNHAQIFVTSFK